MGAADACASTAANPQLSWYAFCDQIYNTAKLTLVMVGPQLQRAVTALAVKGDITYAATGALIEECKRMHK